jgi:hypothetical protein
MAKGFGERPEWDGMGKSLDATEARTGGDNIRFWKPDMPHGGHQ